MAWVFFQLLINCFSSQWVVINHRSSSVFASIHSHWPSHQTILNITHILFRKRKQIEIQNDREKGDVLNLCVHHSLTHNKDRQCFIIHIHFPLKRHAYSESLSFISISIQVIQRKWSFDNASFPPASEFSHDREDEVREIVNVTHGNAYKIDRDRISQQYGEDQEHPR
jgi:hypothetical protein